MFGEKRLDDNAGTGTQVRLHLITLCDSGLCVVYLKDMRHAPKLTDHRETGVLSSAVDNMRIHIHHLGN